MKTLLFCVLTIEINTATDVLTSWTEVHPSTNHVGNSIAGYDHVTNKAYLLGGNCGTSSSCCTCRNDIFTYELDIIESSSDSSWSESEISTEFKSYSQSYVTVNRTIYFAESGKIYTYDMSTNTLNTDFETLPNSDLDNSCMATDGRYLFVTGGRTTEQLTTVSSAATFMIYDLQTTQWISGAPDMIDNRWQHSCVAASNGYLYAIAGKTRGWSNIAEYKSEIERIYIGDISNIDSYSWTKLSSGTSTAKARTACVEMAQKIYIIGGRTTGVVKFYSTVDIIDIADNDNILTGPNLHSSRSAAGVIVGSDNRIYVFRGEGGSQLSFRGSVEISNVILPPTSNPTDAPTKAPTKYPTKYPTNYPTANTFDPTTNNPTEGPTFEPTVEPTTNPTIEPTTEPSAQPTNVPTKPSIDPTSNPTKDPTIEPTKGPTSNPTIDPTINSVQDSAEVAPIPATTECDPYDDDCDTELVVTVFLGLREEVFWIVVILVVLGCAAIIICVICYIKRNHQKTLDKLMQSMAKEKAKSVSVDIDVAIAQPQATITDEQDPNTEESKVDKEQGEQVNHPDEEEDEEAEEDEEGDDEDDDEEDDNEDLYVKHSDREGTASGCDDITIVGATVSPKGDQVEQSSSSLDSGEFYKSGAKTPDKNKVIEVAPT